MSDNVLASYRIYGQVMSDFFETKINQNQFWNGTGQVFIAVISIFEIDYMKNVHIYIFQYDIYRQRWATDEFFSQYIASIHTYITFNPTNSNF